MPNEVDEFFKGLPSENKEAANIFDDKKPPEKAPETEPEKVEESHKNRRHRRLEEQLAQEKEARIRAEALLEGRTESQKFSEETKSIEVPDKWLRIYGDTPDTRLAWKLNQELWNEHSQKVKEETMREIDERQIQSQKKQREFESFIDSELEGIEDKYNVDVTSDAPAARKARRDFLELVQNLSPKDEQGTVTGYADFNATWEMYQLKNAKSSDSNDRRKEIASRSMEKSGSSTLSSERKTTPGFRGWEVDMGL